jgi:hypothetical protein
MIPEDDLQVRVADSVKLTERVVEGQESVQVAGEMLRDLAASTHTILIERDTPLTIASEDS